MQTSKRKLISRIVLLAVLITGSMMVGVQTIDASPSCEVCVEFDEGSGLCVGCCNWCTGWGEGGSGCEAHQEQCACALTGAICYIE